MSDEFYACNQCKVPEPGWRKMFKISHQSLCREDVRELVGFNNLLTEEELKDLNEKVGREVESEKIDICCNCGKPSEAIMIASWEKDFNDDDMINPEKVE